MRTVIVFAAAALAATALQAADTSRNYPVATVDKIGAAGPNEVVVSVGGKMAVRANGDPQMLDKMEVFVRRGALQIRPKEKYRRNFSWKGLPRATYFVTLPRLTDASLAGSGDMTIDRVTGNDFAASVAGSGDMRIGSLRVTKTSLSVAGSGGLTVAGQARQADVSVAGSGDLDGRGLSARTTSVSIAGSGNAKLSAQETAQVSVVGSGSADIAGKPRCTVSRIGSGKVRCGA